MSKLKILIRKKTGIETGTGMKSRKEGKQKVWTKAGGTKIECSGI